MASWREAVKAGWVFTLVINQGDRDLEVLAVRGTQALAEYTMPNGSTDERGQAIWRGSPEARAHIHILMERKEAELRTRNEKSK